MIPYLKRPRIESFWRYLGQVVQVKSCSDVQVVCRPTHHYDPLIEPPLVYALPQFLEQAEPMQHELIPSFNEPAPATAQLDGP